MDDISDPDYAREASILADAMTKRYAHHPAVIAVGYDNEIGNGFMSYSEADRERFINWLKNKYGTIEQLNKVWATQRWSRRLSSFEDVDLPLAEGPDHRSAIWTYIATGPMSQWRGSRNSMRFVAAICLIRRRSRISGIPHRARFRLSQHLQVVCLLWRGGLLSSDPISGVFGALTTKGDLATPMWFNEFTAGGGGNYGTPGEAACTPTWDS